MRISPRSYPTSFGYLTSKGFAPPGSTSPVDVPPIAPILDHLISESKDDHLYLLVPIFLDTVRAFYPHDDALVTLNNFITERYPDPNSESRACLLGLVRIQPFYL